QASSVATERVLAEVVALARKHKLLTVGDSRARAGALKGFDVIVPNDREAGIGAGIEVVDEATLEQAGKKLLGICKNALVTCGAKGITVFAEDGSIENVPIKPCRVVDVTGAGDTVTAAVALTLLAGGSLHEAAVIGNAAAGVAVGQEMVVTVSQAEVIGALSGDAGPAKLRTLDALTAIVAKLRKEGKTVVWTNGCFDILHTGHISYLVKAAAFGDVLIVGLNTDASVRENKGLNRPIVGERDRALVLSALECVDHIILFGEKTTTSLLGALKPDVYAKGGDYTLDTIVQEERRLVEGYGGRIAIIPGVEGQSTSAIIERISREAAAED
ncbi:MAG TPA: D-glycero-beta-D-manno-heptose 1-phosphate adenylyltransferase, partial [Candidatus Hydrogenedentes bacterium]|nr:D-glycero-beta-D-manno-heptose 1-phosphate adenylyltransferase [Candidatus Hydrogenedentota bacterium]